jgi:hypothetical protein
MFPTLAQFSRIGTLASVAAFATIALPPILRAAPPANDSCGGAILIPGVPYLSPVIDVLEATTNGDPVPLPPYTGLTRSIWFKFVPAASALYTISVGEDTQTNFGDVNSTDTVLGLYSAASGCGGPWTFVAENDDAGFLRSALTNNLSAGVNYFIVVWVGPVTQDTNHALNVQLRVTRPVVPANDLCSGAIAIPTATFPYISTNIDTLLATTSANEVSSCGSFRGVWFTFAPSMTGTYILGLDREPATSSIEPTMTLLVSAGGCSGPFTELTCSGDKTRPIIRSLTAGTIYYLLIADIDPEPIPGATAIQLRVSQAGPPTVTTLPASSIASTGAVLNMVINPNGLQTRYFFEWGMTTIYGNMTQNRLLSLGALLVFANPVNTNALVSGFTPGVTYHYRAVGSNSMGKVFGADQTFQYSTNRPTIVGPSTQPGGNFHFRFTANSNQVYMIQSTTDLIQWSDWGPAVDRGGGLFDFSLTGTPGSRRFFKVRSP